MWTQNPWNLENPQWSQMHWLANPFILISLSVWSGIWAGLALWHAARRGEKWWFILFMVVHTAGILEIIYLSLIVKVFGRKKSRADKH